MKKLLICAALAIPMLSTAAAAHPGHYDRGNGYGYGHDHRSAEVRRELRECNRELRRADSRWEYRRELRECRRELAQARRDARYADRYHRDHHRYADRHDRRGYYGRHW